MIATTGACDTMLCTNSPALIQNEIRTITSISPIAGQEGSTITLNSPLQYTHLSVIVDTTFASGSGPLKVNRQAEVGLIAGRNIR